MSYLITLFEQHSYLILFLGIFLELMAFPISGEFLMSYAGYFVYQGKMNYLLALLTVLFSGGVGITATYWIGRAGGYKLIEKYGKYIHLGPERYQKTAAWFERSGSKLLIFAYFIPGIRHFTGYISGISRMPFRKFIIPAYMGSFLWGLCFITLGTVLGPRWEVFHQAARKYFIIFIIVFAIVMAGFLAFRFYKNSIKEFFIHFLTSLVHRLKTIRNTEIFLIFLTIALIGLVVLMLGMAQDYLYDEFTPFNELAEYLVHTSVYSGWLKGFLVFQSPYAVGVMIAAAIFRIWQRDKNRVLEYLLLIVSILGVRIFHETIMRIFSKLEITGFVGKFHSANFPDINAALLIVLYGTTIFLLVRHSKKNYFPISISIIGVILLIGTAGANLETTHVLPSDIIGGYVYGGVWMFFNFLLFEMFRLMVER
ncbi:VTT domain-containing protein [Bacillus sp. ISL-18]|uniref:VTT domain-containing protein n=1 Tax=Bacillus sp. ISL-18 TaxID=2819118 RepID=UPI001BE7998E|nr:VTT domain-containing protein [Bacillus sp. ISL-18]MBT2655787.1 VTT domain-containing protein [Bacillus sp. ISL-18]